MGKREGLPEHTAPEQGLLVISWVDGSVVVRLRAVIPLQPVPPFLLAVALHYLVAVANVRKAPEAPTAPDLDCLKIRCRHSNPTNVL